MKSSRTAETRQVERHAPLLVADAGLPHTVAPADPIDAWLDLMETIEALGPRPQPNTLLRARDCRL